MKNAWVGGCRVNGRIKSEVGVGHAGSEVSEGSGTVERDTEVKVVGEVRVWRPRLCIRQERGALV